jgi:hypothetical protein
MFSQEQGNLSNLYLLVIDYDSFIFLFILMIML